MKTGAKKYHILIGICILLSVFAFLTAAFFWKEAVTSVNLGYHYAFIGRGGVFKYHTIALFSARISLYWLMHFVGLLFMCILNIARRRNVDLSVLQAVLCAFLSALFGFLGAKILYVIENISDVVQNGLHLDGVSFFGALFIIPTAVWVIRHLLHAKREGFLDYCTPSAIGMLGMIRIGCFLNGCCSGIPLTVHDNISIIPVQLLECGLDFAILGFLLWLEKKNCFANRRFYLLLTLYGAIRFILEFLRNTPKVWLGFSNGQIFALIALLAGIICFCKRKPCETTRNIPLPD